MPFTVPNLQQLRFIIRLLRSTTAATPMLKWSVHTTAKSLISLPVPSSAEWSADAWVDWNLNLGPYSKPSKSVTSYAEGIDYDFAETTVSAERMLTPALTNTPLPSLPTQEFLMAIPMSRLKRFTPDRIRDLPTARSKQLG